MMVKICQNSQSNTEGYLSSKFDDSDLWQRELNQPLYKCNRYHSLSLSLHLMPPRPSSNNMQFLRNRGPRDPPLWGFRPWEHPNFIATIHQLRFLMDHLSVGDGPVFELCWGSFYIATWAYNGQFFGNYRQPNLDSKSTSEFLDASVELVEDCAAYTRYVLQGENLTCKFSCFLKQPILEWLRLPDPALPGGSWLLFDSPLLVGPYAPTWANHHDCWFCFSQQIQNLCFIKVIHHDHKHGLKSESLIINHH